MHLKENARERMNELGATKCPFLFIIDFEMKKPMVYPLNDVPDHIRFEINGNKNYEEAKPLSNFFKFDKKPISFADYEKSFKKVATNLHYGNSYLLNLTAQTEIITDLSLEQIFSVSKARYKLLIKDELVVFSPEKFVQINNNIIRSFPMKGTIDADVPNAKAIILADEKEYSEHVTIVDLIRNDLSLISNNVRVEKFRYIEKLKTNAKSLLQVSSEIAGDLPAGYQRNIGDIIFNLLPAGSVSGAPKAKTTEIIYEAEGQLRGYYTGIVGVYDGDSLDSGVMIRYIEKKNQKLYYRSGGGITAKSSLKSEYQEMIDKVYVPFI